MSCLCLALTRREALRLVGVALALGPAGCAPAVSDVHREAGRALLAETLSVDLHSHPGLFPRRYGNTLDTHLGRLERGRLGLLFTAAVADSPVTRVSLTGAIKAVRSPDPGELYASTYRQLGVFQSAIAGGRLTLVRGAGDLATLRAQGPPGALLAVEGGDFLEGRLERVAEAHARGIRSIQLTHYRVNELGDIQTEPAVHGGLTAFGKDVIREMNRLGMLVDVAHATFDAVKAAAEVATRPFILSHTILFTGTRLSRAIDRDHARLVARHGGVIGVFPILIDGPTFNGYIDHLSRLIDLVGADHVGVGTDMDGLPSGASFSDWGEWPTIPAALLSRGYRREDVVKVIGGNFARVFAQVSAA